MPKINSQRLLDDLQKLRSFGAHGNGVVRTALSDVDIESREWLRGKFDEAGLNARIDSVGNVFGISRNSGPALLLGSHSDTQPEGGWLDGAYGVISALEVARSFSEDDSTSECAIDVASWMDEEGTFLGCLGSMSFCEVLDPDELKKATADDGRVLTQVLEQTGLSANSPEVVQPQRQIAYLETHIEQGPVLDTHREKIGVVTGIVGIRECTLIFTGEQNHAGTTPMNLRKDAAASLVSVAAEINKHLPKAASDVSVWTIGSITLGTQSSSIIPGRAAMRLQIRDPDVAVLDRLEALAKEIAEEHDGRNGVRIERQAGEDMSPATMDEALQACIAAAAEAHAPGLWRRMPSGAVHDAQILTKRIPSGMVFVPSISGVSHSFSEDTDEDDLVLGCQVLSDAAWNVLREHIK
jgi:N-carbamoyl-L-amino-acid hydrolase